MARRKRSSPAAQVSVASDARHERVASIDTLRALAILAMVAYHFAFDLRFFGVIAADFENGRFWLAARATIVTSFLLLAGISLVLADRAGVDGRHFLRRIALIALCALAASLASYLIYPQSYIYFGVLHCIALSLLVARPLARRPMTAVVLGVVIVAAGLTIAHPAFDSHLASWIGFGTRKPDTQDYVPLFPWLGVLLLGVGLGHALWHARFRPIAALGRAPRPLLWMGRHSLAIYMIHQPLLMGLLWLALRVRT
jgi:uncharacterized membrane protein